VPISIRRFKVRVSLGDREDPVLRGRIRAQANFAEYVPLALIAIGLCEFSGMPRWFVWSCAASLVAGRTVHAFGMLTGAHTRPRAAGMLFTWASLILAAAGLLWQIAR
jgi:uncharacterized membrane protein YecN with MAPEG domain